MFCIIHRHCMRVLLSVVQWLFKSNVCGKCCSGHFKLFSDSVLQTDRITTK